MTAATKPAKPIAENYRHPLDLSGTGLRYFVSTRTGKHVVVRDLPGGADLMPMVWSFDSIEGARAKWRDLRVTIASEGYERN
jgi:hypothetical protein